MPVTITDPYLQRLAQIESGGNPLAKNPRSSAGGLFQFIDSTAGQYGLKPEDKFKPEKAIPAAKKLTEDNAAILKKKLGRDPSPGELYLAHQQGAGGATKLLSNPQARAIDVLGKDAVLNNGGKEDMTAGEFASKWVNKFEEEEISGGEAQTTALGGEGQDSFTEIEAPDGTVIEFPSGMKDDEIEAAMVKLYPVEQPS